jgi:hypothetical protein
MKSSIAPIDTKRDNLTQKNKILLKPDSIKIQNNTGR